MQVVFRNYFTKVSNYSVTLSVAITGSWSERRPELGDSHLTFVNLPLGKVNTWSTQKQPIWSPTAKRGWRTDSLEVFRSPIMTVGYGGLARPANSTDSVGVTIKPHSRYLGSGFCIRAYHQHTTDFSDEHCIGLQNASSFANN